MVMRQFNKILIVLELGGLMVEMEAMEEFKIQIIIVRYNAHKLSQKLITLEKKPHLKDLVVQAETISNKKVGKVEALSGWQLQAIPQYIILESVQKVNQEYYLKEKAKAQVEEPEVQSQ
jgi:hypothetical protein